MNHNIFFNQAIKEAKKAFVKGEVPVGAVIVKDGIIIAKAYNKKEKLQDVTAHAEILAIKKASKIINNWRLDGCDIYITLEPCPMCLSAIRQSRIDNIFYILGVSFKNENEYNGCNIFNNIANNDLVDKVREMVKSFFVTKRKNICYKI